MKGRIHFNTTALALLLAGVSGTFAGTEELPGTGLSTDFGAAALAGNGLTIAVYGLPVTRGGQVSYANAVLTLSLLPDGSPALLPTGYSAASGPPLVPSSSLDSFTAGSYRDQFSGAEYELTGPSVGTDGRRVWTLLPSRGVSWGATWATGPAAGNPVISGWSEDDYGAATEGPAYGIGTDNFAMSAIQVMNNITLTKYQKVSGGSISVTVLRRQ